VGNITDFEFTNNAFDSTAPSSGEHSGLIFRKFWAQILASDSLSWLRFLCAPVPPNARAVPQIRLYPFPSTPFPIQYPTIQHYIEVTVSIIKQAINKHSVKGILIYIFFI
jgi:hypothetical protein